MDAISDWLKNSSVTSTLIIAISVAYLVHWLLYRQNNKPPGPIGFPIVGYLPFIISDAPKKFEKLRKKYGDVFSIYLGSCYTVVINGHKAMKDGMFSPGLSARPPNNPFDISNIIKSNYDFTPIHWNAHRRFVIHVLKDLGLGKNRMELYIKEELSYLLVKIKQQDGKPISIADILAPSTSNVISLLIFGRRFDYHSAERKQLDENQTAIGKYFFKSAIFIYLPWLHRLIKFFKLFEFEKAKAAALNMEEFVQKEVEEHKRTFDANDIRDYIDAYLLELQKQTRDSEYFNFYGLLNTVHGLFGAGSGTVKETLAWVFLIIAKYQDVQKQVQAEIDEVIGSHRAPSFSDYSKMPYTNAVLMEVQRWRSIITLNVFRYCVQDTILNGYKIPAGTQILANIWSVHNEVDYWKDPEIFRPERFLNDDKTETIRHDYYMPFSIGKLACTGETLARVETFLYFTSILQIFHVKEAEKEPIELDGTVGIGYIPKPQNLRFVERM